MDKQFAFKLIGFFAICACFISWATVSGPKRNTVCKVIAYGYTTLVWICVIALTILTINYK